MSKSRPLSNLEIAKLFRSVSAALTLTPGVNRFRVVAYDRAADAIEHASSEIKDLWDDGELQKLPGIGAGITASLDELFTTGKVKHFDEILAPFPPALFVLLDIPGIGPKSAVKLCQALGISNAHSAISDLEKAAKKGHIRVLPGFGEDSEADILRSIQEHKGRNTRLLIDVAQTQADSIIAWLKKIPEVKQANTLGSLRRQASTVGDIDLSVTSDKPEVVIEHFKKYPYKSRVLEAGTETASLILPNESQVDLMVQPPAAYGSLLQHFTGSKFHNIKLREYALKKGYSLSEHGIKIAGKTKHFDTEEKFYSFLGLDWIPPELREGKDEIDLAKTHKLPKLIQLSDLKGDLHMHSNIDVEPSHDLGQSSVEDMIAAAQALGYEYIGLSEHNPSVSMHTDKQVIDIIKKKTELIHSFHDKFHIFNGLEIDLQPDGKRALPDAALDLLDYAAVSIHSSFRLSRQAMTDRVLRGLDHPKVKFFAHPTARLLGEREGVELDWDRIFAFCLEHDKWLEIDGWPNRLDLPDVLVSDAIKAGVKIIIDSDSHSADHLPIIRYGVSVARRGGCEAKNVVNTLSLKEFSEKLNAK